jgi:hypothetical protein
MKLVADSRGRLTAAEFFRPGTAFNLDRMSDGRIVLAELVEKEVPIVRAVKMKGRWVGNPTVKMDRAAIVESIRQDRESR